MFTRYGLCDYCEDERYATLKIIDNKEEKEICFYCVEEKFSEEYKKVEK